MKKTKIIMFCPKCFAVIERSAFHLRNTEDFEIKIYEDENDHNFNRLNQEIFKDCDCIENYIYLDETSTLQLLMMFTNESAKQLFGKGQVQ